MLEFLFTKTPLSFFTQSLWRDEAFSYFMSKESISNIFYLSANDFTPPVHSLILKFWIWVFGSGEISMRSLSLLFYIISAYFFYLLLTQVLKIKSNWKWAYMFLYFLNPMLHYYAFEVRTYSLVVLLTLMSFYFLLTKRTKALAITSVIGLYTHYFMAFVTLIQYLYLLFTQKNKKRAYKDVALIFVFFLPWVALVLVQNKFISEPFWINALSKEGLWLIPSILYSGYESGFYYLNNIVSNLNLTIYLYIISGVLLIYFKKIKSKKIFLLLTTWAFLPTIIALFLSSYKPVFLARYLIISTPGIILLLILINENLGRVFKYALFSILIILTINYASLQAENRQKQPYNQIISEIKAQASSGDFIFVQSELDYHTTKYYFDENRVFIYGKKYEDIPNFVGKVLIPKNSFKNTIPSYPDKAFMLYPDLTYDIKSVF